MGDHHGGIRKAKLVSYKGQMYSMNQLGKILGLNSSSISHYLKKGLQNGDEIEERIKSGGMRGGRYGSPRTVIYHGKEMRISELSQITGIHPSTIYKALNAGENITKLANALSFDKTANDWEDTHTNHDLPTEEELFLDWIHYRGEYDEVDRLACLSGRGFEWADAIIDEFETRLEKRQGDKYVDIRKSADYRKRSYKKQQD